MATETVNGLAGMWYREGGLTDPLSGLSDQLFWLSLPALLSRLRDNAFSDIQVIRDDPGHANGPCVTLAARLAAQE